jgi:hypothetical protein
MTQPAIEHAVSVGDHEQLARLAGEALTDAARAERHEVAELLTAHAQVLATLAVALRPMSYSHCERCCEAP